MSYIVLEDFADLKDKNKVYRKGEQFPRPANKNVSKKRFEELSSAKNRMGAPLIKLEEEGSNEEQK